MYKMLDTSVNYVIKIGSFQNLHDFCLNNMFYQVFTTCRKYSLHEIQIANQDLEGIHLMCKMIYKTKTRNGIPYNC